MIKGLRHVIIIVAFIVSPSMLDSCICACGCDYGSDDGPPHYDFEAMSISLHTFPDYNSLPPTPRLSGILFETQIDAKYTQVSGHGGSLLYACSPAPIIANQQIISIEILSNNDLVGHPATIKAGNDLSLFFIARTEMNDAAVDEVVKKEFRGNRLDFRTPYTLDIPQSHTFTFRITLDNGQVFEMVTQELTLAAG
jgi:hypothetical protein